MSTLHGKQLPKYYRQILVERDGTPRELDHFVLARSIRVARTMLLSELLAGEPMYDVYEPCGWDQENRVATYRWDRVE